MSVKASPESIRAMKQDIQATTKDMEHISQGIKAGVAANTGWDDAQAQEFNQVMRRIAQLASAPTTTLQGSIPKLDRLIASLEEYHKIKF